MMESRKFFFLGARVEAPVAKTPEVMAYIYHIEVVGESPAFSKNVKWRKQPPAFAQWNKWGGRDF